MRVTKAGEGGVRILSPDGPEGQAGKPQGSVAGHRAGHRDRWWVTDRWRVTECQEFTQEEVGRAVGRRGRGVSITRGLPTTRRESRRATTRAPKTHRKV